MSKAERNEALDLLLERYDSHSDLRNRRLWLRDKLEVLLDRVFVEGFERGRAEVKNELLKKAMDKTGGLEKVGEAAARHIYDRVKNGTPDPEINAIREGVKKSIREGTKGTIGEQTDDGWATKFKIADQTVQAYKIPRTKILEHNTVEEASHDPMVVEQLKRIRVVCAHEIRELDCVATPRLVIWSCPCGFRYEKAPIELPMMPDTVMIDMQCHGKKGP